MRRLLLAALACLVLAGCGEPVTGGFVTAREPVCRYQGRQGTTLVVLMAQAVPTASQLPCIELLPAGWSVRRVGLMFGVALLALLALAAALNSFSSAGLL